jgi:hypothetical protein
MIDQIAAREREMNSTLIGDGLTAEDDPYSSYRRGGFTAPSWPGRPYAAPGPLGWQARRH